MICPYCSQPAKFLTSSEVVYHGRDYGPIWICAPCKAWCGCHPGTTKPLGRLANAEPPCAPKTWACERSSGI